MKNNILALFFLLFIISSQLLFSQDLKLITGKVSYQDAPLKDVHITNIKAITSVNTDSNGKYQIEASIGDTLVFTHVGMQTLTIIIEDVTTTLNLKMYQNANILDTVEINTTSNAKRTKNYKKKNEAFVTSKGKFNPKTSGFSNNYVDGSAISFTAPDIQQALIGKIPGYAYERNTRTSFFKRLSSLSPIPVLWEVDGLIMEDPPLFLDLNQIEWVRAIQSRGAAVKYGSLAAGGVIIIKTTLTNHEGKASNDNSDQYKNQNFYINDAIATTLERNVADRVFNAKTFENKDIAYQYYTTVLKEQLKDYAEHIDIATQFITVFNDTKTANEILEALVIDYDTNAEVLKAIAYNYQNHGNKYAALKVYKKIFLIRSNYAQSYRDLAQAYQDMKMYQNAWNIYLLYLKQFQGVPKKDVKELIFNDMEWLYYNKNKEAKIRQKFIPESQSIKDFQKDIKMVFEWNTSEAEFEIEFVNSDKRSYVFDHSLQGNSQLITREKQIGFSSKAFFIDNLYNGEWLVNFIYKGNKIEKPTFMKLTTYYNWGKVNQNQKVTIYRLDVENQKVVLQKLIPNKLKY